jgi:selenide,water dikinase
LRCEGKKKCTNARIKLLFSAIFAHSDISPIILQVGSTTLSNAMKKISSMVVDRPEVVMGVDSPDDCAVVAIPNQRTRLSSSGSQRGVDSCNYNVHTVDFFRSFYEDPYVFGKVAACHALSDCHAMGVPAVSALAVVVLPFGLESKVEDALVQVS